MFADKQERAVQLRNQRLINKGERIRDHAIILCRLLSPQENGLSGVGEPAKHHWYDLILPERLVGRPERSDWVGSRESFS